MLRARACGPSPPGAELNEPAVRLWCRRFRRPERVRQPWEVEGRFDIGGGLGECSILSPWRRDSM